MTQLEDLQYIVHSLALIHNLVIYIFHWTAICLSSDAHTRVHHLSIWALSIIFASSLLVWATPQITEYNDWDWPLSPALCHWIRLPVRLSYLWSKMMGLYYVYIMRLFDIFRGNIYAFHRWQMYSLRYFIIAVTVLFTIGGTLQPIKDSDYDAERNRCNISLPSTAKILFAFIDLVFVNVIIVLYCRRLLFFEQKLNLRLLQNVPPPHPHRTADEMYLKVMVRSAVLTFVAMISSQVTVIIIYVKGDGMMVAAIELVINTWCLVLIFEIYDHLCNCYRHCCCLCEKLMCHQCIVLYSCYWCCRLNLGDSNDFRLNITAVAGDTALDPTSGDNAPRGHDGNMNDDHGGNVELQLAEPRHNVSSNDIEITDRDSIGIQPARS